MATRPFREQRKGRALAGVQDRRLSGKCLQAPDHGAFCSEVKQTMENSKFSLKLIHFIHKSKMAVISGIPISAFPGLTDNFAAADADAVLERVLSRAHR